MLNFIRHLLSSNRKRCLSRLIGLGHNMGVILIMAGGFKTVVTNHDFQQFLTKVDEVWEVKEMSCYSNMVLWRGFYRQSCPQPYRRDANWELPSGFDRRFPRFWGITMLKPVVLNGLEATQPGSTSQCPLHLVSNLACGEPLKEGNQY